MMVVITYSVLPTCDRQKYTDNFGFTHTVMQGFLQDFTFWGGVEGLWGGSSLGVGGLRVIKNKVSKNFVGE